MTCRLADCTRGDRVTIVRIEAGRGAILQLMNLGLDVGHVIELRQRSPLRGPLLVQQGGTEIAIGHGLAEKIWVEKSPAEEG